MSPDSHRSVAKLLEATSFRLTYVHPMVLQSFLVVQALYGLSMCTVKWSILFMLKRIFAVKPFEVGSPPVDNQYRIVLVLLTLYRHARRSWPGFL